MLKSRLGILLKAVIDLGESLRGTGEARIGHRGIALAARNAHSLGRWALQKLKKVGTSNWGLNRRLSERQLLYAANDAHGVASMIYRAWMERANGKKQPKLARTESILSPPDQARSVRELRSISPYFFLRVANTGAGQQG